MSKQSLQNFFGELYDKLTVMKGFLQLETERNNVDYSLILLHELEEFETILNEFYDLLIKLDDDTLEGNDEETPIGRG